MASPRRSGWRECAVCQGSFRPNRFGRPRDTCSNKCRQRRYRLRKARGSTTTRSAQ